MIKADYLLESDANSISAFLFIGKRNKDEKEQMCRTFFEKSGKDYTEGQPRYTLLKKEKRNLLTGEVIVQYDRMTTKEQNYRSEIMEGNNEKENCIP